MMPSIRFNGRENPDYVLVHTIEDNLIPDISVNTLKINGRDGEHRFSKNIGMREISVTLSIVGEDVKDVKKKARALVNDWLYTDGLAKFVNLDEPEVFYMAEISDTGNLVQNLTLGQTTLTFLCPTPYAYSQDESVISMLNLPASGAIEFENDGKDVFPIFSMTFTEDVRLFSIVTESRHMTFGHANGPVIFRNNDELAIDGENGIILKNGERFYEHLLPASEFLKFGNGFNAVIMNPRHTIRNVTMRLRKRWL